VVTYLSVSHVSKRFGSCVAVNDVSLDVEDGEAVVLLGASGSGKTTVLRLIAGLERPDAGDILIARRVVARAGANVVAPHERGIGFVFQDHALWPHLTVRQHVEFALRATKLHKAEQKLRVQSSLALVRIESLADRYPFQISGGEQQRVALARALAPQPRLLLCDEPLSSLDPELRTAMRDEIVHLQRRLGIAAVYVTHERQEAAVLGDRVVEMRAGRLEPPRARWVT
jgi:ABC-type Fe3+/spermidine/putrescine transport system ATPase subunit